MKISVVTITCRTDPRLRDMARTLLASLAVSGGDVELEWVVVDEKLWLGGAERAQEILEVAAGLPAEIRERFTLRHTPPTVTAYRGPRVSSPAPAHNSARNAGLAAATGEFVVFLDDCTIVTGDFLNVARDCGVAGAGWRCKSFSMQDAIVRDGPFKHRDHWDRLRSVPPMTVGGPCWGAPRAALEAIHGFDVAYDGEDHGHELETVIRLGRSGIKFVTTERANSIQLRRTKHRADVTSRPEITNGRNQKLIGDLQRAKGATEPTVRYQPGRDGNASGPRLVVVVPPAVVVSPVAAPAVTPRVRKASKSERRAARAAAPAVAEVPRAAPPADDGPEAVHTLEEMGLDLSDVDAIDSLLEDAETIEA
jgi:hypothetical protein